jgi:hypothetical protein
VARKIRVYRKAVARSSEVSLMKESKSRDRYGTERAAVLTRIVVRESIVLRAIIARSMSTTSALHLSTEACSQPVRVLVVYF